MAEFGENKFPAGRDGFLKKTGLAVLVLLLAGLLGAGLHLAGRNQADRQPADFRKNFSRTKSRRIIVSGEIAGISLRLADKQALEEFLEAVGFWQESGARIYRSASLATVRELEIRLTDKEQKYGRFLGPDAERAYQSFGQSLAKDRLIVYLHFDREKIKRIYRKGWFIFSGK